MSWGRAYTAAADAAYMGTTILPRNVERVAPSAAPARVFLFPGQSSVGPASRVTGARGAPGGGAGSPIARVRYSAMRARLSTWTQRGARLRSNRDIQITVFLATQMYLAALDAEGVEAGSSLGLSLGEYSHLVHIGALDLEMRCGSSTSAAAATTRRRRGSWRRCWRWTTTPSRRSSATRGAYGPIAISNINAPTQHVIAGAEPAVSWAVATLEDEHAAHITIIERRVPMHSPHDGAGREGVRAGAGARAVATAGEALLAERHGAPIAHPTPGDFVAHLTRHVSEPVLWQRSVDAVVVGLPGRDVHRSRPRRRPAQHDGPRVAQRLAARALDAPEGIDPREHFAATVEALRA